MTTPRTYQTPYRLFHDVTLRRRETHSEEIKCPRRDHRKVDQRPEPATNRNERDRQSGLKTHRIEWRFEFLIHPPKHGGKVAFSTCDVDQAGRGEGGSWKGRRLEEVACFKKAWGLPFRAPKHDIATMSANTIPPAGPNRARPKSSATVLLRPTVS